MIAERNEQPSVESPIDDITDIYEDTKGNIISPESLDSISIGQIRHEKGLDMQDALDQLLEDKPEGNTPVRYTEALKERADFRPIGMPRRFRDVIGVLRHLHRGGVESDEKYDDKRKILEEKGLVESAAFGRATVGGRDFTLFSSEMAYLAGTLGVSMGEQFLKATEHAIEHKQPLVSLFSSGGARQQESTAGLMQMPAMTEMVSMFRDESTMPNVSIINESWGGISGSAAALGDVRIGVRGSKYGFAGPKVIDNYKEKNNSFDRRYQTVESNYLDGNIDMIFDSPEETEAWLEMLMSISKDMGRDRHSLPKIVDPASIKLPTYYDRFPFDQTGFINRMQAASLPEEGVSRTLFSEPSKHDIDYKRGMDTFDQYQMLIRNPHRPDTDLLMHSVFDKLLPLYSSTVTEDQGSKVLKYPPIIAAIGVIGSQPFLVLGNQPSYREGSDGEPRVIPASPNVKSFQRRNEWLQMGARMGLPLVSFVNVLGANPDIPEERSGLSQVVANSTLEGQAYPHPIFTYVTGTFGSGGGVASGPIGERFAMLEGAHMYVAAPVSSTVILYSPEDASIVDNDLVRKTIHTSRVTAKDQLDLGLIDAVIKEPRGGGQRDQHALAYALKVDIVEAARRYRGMDRKDMRKARREKLLTMGHHHLEVA